jgi:hypothetical protein
MLKNKFATCFAWSALALSGAAAAAQTAAPGPQPTAPQACALPSLAASVDLKDVPGTNLLTVPVKINGKDKQFLLDIGTNLTEVSQQAAADLHLPNAANSHSDNLNLSPGVDHYKEQTGYANFEMNATLGGSFQNIKGASSPDNYREHVKIGSFTLGAATGQNLVFAVAKDAEMGKAKTKPYDGLMTGDFFKQYDVELNPAGKKLNYLTPATCSDPQRIAYWPHMAVAVIPMTVPQDGKIHVQVGIQGHVIDATIDTSSDHTVMRRGLAEQTLGFQAGKDMMPADRVDGIGQPVYVHTFPQISFAGGVVAVNVPTDIQNYGNVHDTNRAPVLGSRAQFSDTAELPDLTLGMDVVQQLHLLIVPGQKNIYVTQE